MTRKQQQMSKSEKKGGQARVGRGQEWNTNRAAQAMEEQHVRRPCPAIDKTARRGSM